MTERVDLPDVNLWLALGLPEHPHHHRAKAWWDDEMPGRTAFCRVTALGMVRLLCNPAVTGGRPLPPSGAWAAYREFAELHEVLFAPEPERVETVLGSLVETGAVTPRLWTDAYLAAFALSAGMRLVSFDNDFARFDGLDWYRP